MPDKDDHSNIALLAQRLETQVERSRQQDRQIEELQKTQHKIEGAQESQDKAASSNIKLIGPILGLVVTVIGLMFGKTIYDTQDELSTEVDLNRDKIHAEDVEIKQRFEKKDQKIIQVNQAIKKLEERVKDHIDLKGHPNVATRLAVIESKKIPSLSSINQTLVNVNTRLKIIEADLDRDEGKFDELKSSVVSLQSENKTLAAGVSEHEEELDNAEASLASLTSSLSSTRASTGAAFVEVETQVRALVDVMNTQEASRRQLMQLTWTEMGKDLPENDYFPSNIPAQATTQVGKVNGD